MVDLLHLTPILLTPLSMMGQVQMIPTIMILVVPTVVGTAAALQAVARVAGTVVVQVVVTVEVASK
jgi:hypothetical protein